MATLAEIRQKVRILSRRKTPMQMSDATIDNYINTFVLYDMPYRDQVFHLKRTFKFLTSPYVGQYGSTTDVDDIMYNFKDRIVSVDGPVFIHGQRAYYSQDRSEFYGYYTQSKYQTQIALGDGATTVYTGVLGNAPIVQGSMVVSAQYIDVGNITKMGYFDRPENLNGLIRTYGLFVPSDTATVGYGLIDYVKGDYTLSFPFPPTSGTPIVISYVPYTASQPRSMLFYGDTITLRPIPDKVYEVEFNATIQPTLMVDGSTTEVDQWWQYIAIGAARKIFQDDLDNDSAALLEPQFQEQEELCTRKLTWQLSQQRTSTIYVAPRMITRYPWNSNFMDY